MGYRSSNSIFCLLVVRPAKLYNCIGSSFIYRMLVSKGGNRKHRTNYTVFSQMIVRVFSGYTRHPCRWNDYIVCDWCKPCRILPRVFERCQCLRRYSHNWAAIWRHRRPCCVERRPPSQPQQQPTTGKRLKSISFFETGWLIFKKV